MSILSILGISDAFAQNTATTAANQTGQGGSLLSTLPILVVFILVFYFLLIRPQSKRAKEHRKLLEGLAKGDEVMTTGGIVGKVAKIEDNFITLTVASNVDLTFQKGSIATVLPKGSFKSI